VVAPLLRELGFGATFFVTHRWMPDAENFLTWKEVAEIHQMGFEIGNHTWTHDDFSLPRNAARLAGELALVENELAQVGVPRPVSFAYPGNGFGPEAVKTLSELGYKFARRGISPEVEYGEIRVGSTFDPSRHHSLLIPTTGDAYPDWTQEHFERVVAAARTGQIVVLQFHGVPDPAHPWVHTPPENFRRYMTFLKEQECQVMAVRDLERYLNLKNPPADPMLKTRFPEHKYGCLPLPVEVEATRADLRYWLANMLRDHGYTLAEAAQVCGSTESEVQRQAADWGIRVAASAGPENQGQIRVLPYPGGRHPRIGFLEGAVAPMRGTKASVFLPWDPASYVVVDLPEAIFSNRGLIFLAHTHIPTVWNEQNLVLDNIDWNREAGASLSFRRMLPDGTSFGASIRPVAQAVEMELWLRNLTHQPLSGLRTQVCVMLKGARDFNGQTNANTLFRQPVAAVRSTSGDRWILTAWEHCGRVWANPPVPCLHSDPVFPDCPPATTVRVRGRLWFYHGSDIERELERARTAFGAL
jgi:peptidoglycan/xylan/chitin deacetylase (PgdA/CDA1 family)